VNRCSLFVGLVDGKKQGQKSEKSLFVRLLIEVCYTEQIL
jgi:hypothetical protein